MTTIEQRANEFAEKEYYTGSYEKERLSFGYYHGATEQRQIDIEKACKVHCQCCSCYNNMCEGADSDCRQYVYFRKAMEDKV